MEAVRSKITEAGLDHLDIVIEGVQSYRFKKSVTTVSGNAADDYEAYISGLKLKTNETTVALPPDSVEFREMASALSKTRFSLPLYNILVEAGAPAPTKTQAFKFSYARVEDICNLDDQWFDALLADDKDTLREVEWKIFQMTASFVKTPCSKETYDTLKDALSESGHLTVMSFGQFYDWYVKSSVKLDADGKMTAEAEAEANYLIDAWLPGTMDGEEIKYWLCRNLSIHPVHRAPFEALIDERVATSRPEAPVVSTLKP